MMHFINFLRAAVLNGAPLLYGTLGEIITQKSGNLNLGVEGIMSIGAIAGFYVGYRSNSIVLAIIAAFLAGIFASLIYAFLTVTMKANQNVTGLTLTIFGVGFANFMGDFIRSSSSETVLKLSTDLTERVGDVHIPYLSDIPYIGELFFQYNPLIYFGIFLCILAGIYIKYTRAGLNLRAVGENPAAADASGININRTKYVNILLGGGICGIGGAYISLVLAGGVWVESTVGGLGWISIALVIFANWNPFFAVLGSFIFGAFRVLKFYIPSTVIDIPDAFFDMLPFVITALVLIVTSIRQSKGRSEPAGIGVNYFREER